MIADLARRIRVSAAHERIGDELFELCEDEDLEPVELIALLAYLTGAIIGALEPGEISQAGAMDLIWKNVAAGAEPDTQPLALNAGRSN